MFVMVMHKAGYKAISTGSARVNCKLESRARGDEEAGALGPELASLSSRFLISVTGQIGTEWSVTNERKAQVGLRLYEGRLGETGKRVALCRAASCHEVYRRYIVIDTWHGLRTYVTRSISDVRLTCWKGSLIDELNPLRDDFKRISSDETSYKVR